MKTYPLAIIAAVMAAVLFGALRDAGSDSPGASIGGDYPAFYGAGKIAAAGDLDNLYNVARQVQAQEGLHDPAEGEVTRFFPYPPQFAVLYQPLASLGYYWSYLIHTLIMGLLLWGSILLARPMLPWLRGRVSLALAASLLFWPMFRTVTGGSNTALTLFLVVAAWRLIHEEREVAAGLVLAGLLFKPQFAIPLLGLFVLARYWRVVTGAAIGAAGFYLWGVAISGWSWSIDWAEMARDFGAKEAEINGHSSISFIGFTQNIFGVGFKAPVVLAWMCAIGVAVLLSALWWRSHGTPLGKLLAITAPGILLLAPHVMTHDGALTILTAAVLVQAWQRSRWLPWLSVVWLLGATQSMILQLGFSPGFPMLLILLALAWQLLQQAPEAPHGGGEPGEDHDSLAASENST